MEPSQHDERRFILGKSACLLSKKTAVSQYDVTIAARQQ
ncbi:hypothetical protein A2U01_0039756, partial [Trifolium medium]|nr:hypothetical protein [Trifolium medium]